MSFSFHFWFFFKLSKAQQCKKVGNGLKISRSWSKIQNEIEVMIYPDLFPRVPALHIVLIRIMLNLSKIDNQIWFDNMPYRMESV